MNKLKWGQFIWWRITVHSVKQSSFEWWPAKEGSACQPEWGLPWKLAQSAVGKLGLSGSLPHTITLKIFLRLSFGHQSLRPGSSSCYLPANFRAGRQATWATVLMEMWGHEVLGKSMLDQLGEISSGGTPHHSTCPTFSAWQSPNTSTLPYALEARNEKDLLNNEYEDAQTNEGNFYLCDC